jgi:alkylation response protein AidB-like acyl-CoA dehydrogenase
MEDVTRYHPSPDQLAVAEAVEDSLTDLMPLARIHGSAEESADVWSSLAGLGVFAIGVSEDKGGAGLGAAEEAFIAIGLGRRIAAPSVYATMGAAHAEVASDKEFQVRRTAAGYRSGKRIIVVQDSQAERCLVRDGAGAAALYQLGNQNSKVLDDTSWLDPICDAGDLGKPLAQLDARQALRLRLLDAAALAGIADTALKMGTEYAKLREQFGRPIGTFQAVKHHCANMAINARCARDQVGFAAVAVDDGRGDAEYQVETAFLVAANAAIDNAGINIQVHGGIGFSDEADPHMLLKRAQLITTLGGGLEAVTERIADIKPIW